MEELRLVPLSEYQADCRVLEIEPGASLEEVRQAYRDQTKVWHPDRFVNDARLQKKAEERIRQINLAYRRLCGRSPYDRQVLSSAISASPSDWRIALFALGRALRNSVSVIAKPFRLLIGKAINIANSVFEWCRRERRSLAIATSAFVLGVAFGTWLLPRESETWIKISSLLQKTIKKNGTAQVAVAQSSGASLTPSPKTGLLATSSPEIGAPLPSLSLGTNSNPAMTEASANVSPRNTNATTTPFWLHEEQVPGKTLTQYASAWEKHWLKIFGGMNDPRHTARGTYMPTSFVSHPNTFYDALLNSNVEQGQLKPEEPNVVSRSRQTHAEPDDAIAQQQPDESTRTSHAPAAEIEPSHRNTPPDQSVASPSPERELAERKKSDDQAATKAVPIHRVPTGSVTLGSVVKAIATYAPRPNYPEEARSQHIAGRGVCVVSVDFNSGTVTDVSIAQSTGSRLLDHSVIRTLRSWKFRPGTVSQVGIPVEFTIER
jgi:TonB family protein